MTQIYLCGILGCFCDSQISMWNKIQTQTFIQLPELLKPTLRDPKISTVSVLEQIKAAVINLISQLQCILEGIVGQ